MPDPVTDSHPRPRTGPSGAGDDADRAAPAPAAGHDWEMWMRGWERHLAAVAAGLDAPLAPLPVAPAAPRPAGPPPPVLAGRLAAAERRRRALVAALTGQLRAGTRPRPAAEPGPVT